ncbi:MAG: PaaI family thioesterase [Myxococcota bacterium]
MPEDFAAVINALPGDGWVRAMGLTITRATVDEVWCEWDVDERHRQGYGIVHGGVYCGVIETITSIGAHLVAAARGQRTVGLDNHTSFVKAVRDGHLRAVATPVSRGRTVQLWDGQVFDADGAVVARGTVRLLCLPADRPL